jgi:hypothetical protein
MASTEPTVTSTEEPAAGGQPSSIIRQPIGQVPVACRSAGTEDASTGSR